MEAAFLAKFSKRVGVGRKGGRPFVAEFSERVGLGRNRGRPFLAKAKFYILYQYYGFISNSTDHAVTPFFSGESFSKGRCLIQG